MLRVKRTIIAGLAMLCAAPSMATTAQAATAQVDAAAQGGEAPATERRAPVSLDRLTRHTELVKAFTVASITDVVIELGFTASVAAIEGDYPLILVRDERGAGFALQPMVCDGNDPDDACHGLLLVVALQGRLNFPGISVNQVNRFNDLQFYGRGHVVRQGAGEEMAILSRLILSDYGTTRGNLGVELTTFRSAVYNYAQYLSQLRIAASIADSGGSSGGGENALSHVRSPLNSQAFVARGAATPVAARPADFDADMARLPHLIEQWGRTGILKDFQFPAEALAPPE